jgi:hypothetical protein
MQNKGTYVTICSGNVNKVGIQTTFFLPYNRWRYGFVPKDKKLSDKIAVIVMNAVPVCVPGMSKKK